MALSRPCTPSKVAHGQGPHSVLFEGTFSLCEEYSLPDHRLQQLDMGHIFGNPGLAIDFTEPDLRFRVIAFVSLDPE